MTCTHEKYELHATCVCGEDATEKARGQLLQIEAEAVGVSR